MDSAGPPFFCSYLRLLVESEGGEGKKGCLMSPMLCINL